ncbi:MAG: hypothetical protein QNJ34_18470 [Xenococcaceae cyanobacterium MO_188.B29]|nr:hypothetical protein [Xenococcaceae cyanobacterium MO_188.B29]
MTANPLINSEVAVENKESNSPLDISTSPPIQMKWELNIGDRVVLALPILLLKE